MMTRISRLEANTVWPLSAIQSQRQRTVFRRLRAIGRLKDGWHVGTGKAVPSLVLQTAEKMLAVVVGVGLERYDVFPGRDGTLTVVIYIGDSDHSFEIQQDHSVRYWDEAKFDDAKILTLPQAFRHIYCLPHAWNSFITFQFGAGTSSEDDSAVKHLKLQATEPESLLRLRHASWTEPEISVGTDGSITPTSSQTRPYSGALTRKYFPVAVA
jgi:hypothetical protein